LTSVAFALIVGGLVLIYGEFIWVGKLIFGVVGALIALAGVSLLMRFPLTRFGMSLIGASILCFVVDAAVDTYWVAGVAGTVLWALGFWKLCRGVDAVLPQVVIPVSLIFGALTTVLLSIARRARRNKRAA
jgi:membrane-bound ClpP family serine protease